MAHSLQICDIDDSYRSFTLLFSYLWIYRPNNKSEAIDVYGCDFMRDTQHYRCEKKEISQEIQITLDVKRAA